MKNARSLLEALREHSALPWTLTVLNSLAAGSWVLVLSIFGDRQRLRRNLRSNLWTVLPLLIIAAQSALTGRIGLGVEQFFESFVVVAALSAGAPRQRLRPALLLAIIALSTLTAISGALHRGEWHRLYGTAKTPLVGIGPTGGVFRIRPQSDHRRTEVSQTWAVPRDHVARPIAIRYRLHAGQPGISWRASSGITQVTNGSDRFAYAQLAATKGMSGTAERAYASASGLGGKRLSVTMSYRGELVASSKRHCMGVALQVRSEAWSGTCTPLTPHSDSWTTMTLQWTVPSQQTARTIWLEVALGPGSAFDIRGVQVEQWDEGHWVPLSPSEPSGLAVYMDWRTSLHAPIQSTFVARGMPSPHWKSLRAPVPARPNDAKYLTVRASIEPGLSVDVGESAQSGTLALRQSSPADRQALWFGHPNLLGHTIATATVAAVALGPSSLLGTWMALLASGPGIWGSGSRAAAVAVLMAALAFTFLRLGRRRWRAALSVGVIACVIVGVVMVVQHAVTVPRLASLSEVVPRYDVWESAARAFASAPLRGPGNDSLAKFGSFSTGNVPRHAHNLFLEAALENGLVGLLATAWFFGRLAQLAWRKLRWRGAILVGTVLWLNIVDVTLFSATVLVPLLLAIGPPVAGPNGWRKQPEG